MKNHIDTYRDIIVQIATPTSTGTGFYLKERGLVVTNHHVVEGNRDVVIEGARFPKRLARVFYTDQRYDLAFLEGPTEIDLPAVGLGTEKRLRQGDPVTAMGHPFGLKFSVKNGIVSNEQEVVNGIPYVHIDAALNPGNSGGPLIDAEGEIVGINTFIIKNGDNTGFSLPVRFVQEALDGFSKQGNSNVGRCTACLNFVTEASVENKLCAHCGNRVELPGQVEAYTPTGVAKTIENLITQNGYDVALSRCGANAWEIIQGSAKILITYHDKTGLMSADAILCQLPKENIKPLYEYLLRENYTNEVLTLSVHDQDIILSLLIYDRYLNEETGMAMLRNLFDKADYYDNILVERYGATWKPE